MNESSSVLLGLHISADYEADFLAEIDPLEKMKEDHVQRNGRKAASFLKDNEGPPSHTMNSTSTHCFQC